LIDAVSRYERQRTEKIPVAGDYRFDEDGRPGSAGKQPHKSRWRLVMKTMNQIVSILGMVGALTLGACTSMSPSSNYENTSYDGTSYRGNNPNDGYYPGYGVVQSVELVRQDRGGIGGSGFGLGTVAGAVVGGVVGSQVGSGSGATAATVIGAAGGAYVGHELEKRQQPQQADAYRINVRMDDGSYQAPMQSTSTDLRAGDRVRIENGVVQRY